MSSGMFMLSVQPEVIPAPLFASGRVERDSDFIFTSTPSDDLYRRSHSVCGSQLWLMFLFVEFDLLLYHL